jgi:hypothetical protein
MKPGLTAAPINRTEPSLDPETPTTTGPADTMSLKDRLRAKKGATSAPSGFKTYKAAANAKGVMSAGKQFDSSNMVSEAGPGVLPQSIIDKAILKAAQEAEIMNTKQGKTSAQQTQKANLAGVAPTDTDGDGDIDATDTAKASSGGGFGAGLKKGFTGKTPATPDLAGLEQRIAAIEKKVGLA